MGRSLQELSAHYLGQEVVQQALQLANQEKPEEIADKMRYSIGLPRLVFSFFLKTRVKDTQVEELGSIFLGLYLLTNSSDDVHFRAVLNNKWLQLVKEMDEIKEHRNELQQDLLLHEIFEYLRLIVGRGSDTENDRR